MKREFCAFEGNQKVADGDLLSVAEKLKLHLLSNQSAHVTVYDKRTSQITDVHLKGTRADTEKWIRCNVPDALPKPNPGRGRPKLGVVSKEITLLPRQWQWLSKQQGGASVTLRKLVDAAAKDPAAMQREAQDATYHFATSLAGDAVGFEEAMRALYAKDEFLFGKLIAAWPHDVKEHIRLLAQDVW